MTSRVTRDEMLMEVAHAIAKRGTCSRLQVGAVFSRDGRIVSTGYNGAPAGMPHCIHEEYIWREPYTLEELPKWMFEFLKGSSEFTDTYVNPQVGMRFAYEGDRVIVSHTPNGNPGSSRGCEQAEHAERNAIAWAARHGLALEGTEVHVTHMPCLACARTMINAGVTRVMYKEEYRLRDGIILLANAGVEVRDWYEPARKIDPRF